MIKNIAWNMFKNTGNIDTFLEFKQIKDIENNTIHVSGITGNSNVTNTSELAENSNFAGGGSVLNNVPTIQKVELNGNNKNEWNNNF